MKRFQISACACSMPIEASCAQVVPLKVSNTTTMAMKILMASTVGATGFNS